MVAMSGIATDGGLWDRIHGGYIRARRARILADRLASLIPPNSRVIDIGCGDGLIAHAIMKQRADLDIQGVEVLIYDKTHIPISLFDGTHVQVDDQSCDAALIVDVLHHSDDGEALLSEARRIAKKTIIIKDVVNDGFLADFTLRWMDRLGNERYGVACPFNFWPRRRWLDTFTKLDLALCSWEGRIGLYPWPAGMLFERSMHFIAAVVKP
jgi:SAM-dependent methyltransferase